MKGYNEKKLRDLLNDKKNELKELDNQVKDLQELLTLAKHPHSKTASIPAITEQQLSTALDTINKKRDKLTLVINCVKDNLCRMAEAKKQYEEIYKSQFNDSMFLLKRIDI